MVAHFLYDLNFPATLEHVIQKGDFFKDASLVFYRVTILNKTANTYKLNAFNKALIKLSSQTQAIETGLIKTPFNIHYC